MRLLHAARLSVEGLGVDAGVHSMSPSGTPLRRIADTISWQSSKRRLGSLIPFKLSWLRLLGEVGSALHETPV